MRPKKLLMHKKEILRLFGLVKQDGYALIPLSLYFKGPRVKLELGLCKGIPIGPPSGYGQGL